MLEVDIEERNADGTSPDRQSKWEHWLNQRLTERNVNSMEQIRAKTEGRVPVKTKDKKASNRYTEGLFGIHREHK